MLRTYRYRIYPTQEQAFLINKHVGACRFVYNLALEVKNTAYASAHKNLTCFDLISQLPDLKKECEWLKEVDSQALQQSIINLDKAFTAFFKGNAAFPKFKKKHHGNSFRNPHGNKVTISNNKLFQPKFIKEGIRIEIDREHKGAIKNTTISRAPTGKYFVSILCETGQEIPEKKTTKESTTIGVDLGLKDFIVTSEGEKSGNPKYLKKSLVKLKFLSRQYSRKKKGSNNRKKAQRKIALCHEKVVNQRKDFLHKLSTNLVKNHDTICFETLKIENMIKNHKLAQSISDAGWGMFVEMCKYKAEWSGKNVLQIPTFQPSTKLCSNCGHTNHKLTLADRQWMCEGCKTAHDRDVNAAINIKNYSLKNCGRVSRGKPVELPTLVGAVKQEKQGEN